VYSKDWRTCYEYSHLSFSYPVVAMAVFEAPTVLARTKRQRSPGKRVKAGGGSHSDRSMRIGGALLVQTSTEIIRLGKARVAQQLGCAADDVVFKDGVFAAKGASVSLAELAADQPLRAEADFVGRMAAHPTGCAVCELEVDPETGDVALTHYTSIDDAGRLINPLIVEGQVHGGLAQGIGQALSEGFHVDPESGQVLSGSYMDYGVPRAGCIPELSLEFTEDPTTGNPLGVKGGGESGITPATASIFNALADALQANLKPELAMPATPEVVWSFIHRPA
jgi:carbon-monoxide dehydrogenase large subunit